MPVVVAAGAEVVAAATESFVGRPGKNSEHAEIAGGTEEVAEAVTPIA